MSSSQETVLAPTACTREVADLEGLSSFFEDAVQIVTWTRPLDARVERFARDVLAERPFELRESIAKDDACSFDPVPDFARTADPRGAELFANDLRSLIGTFGDLMETKRVKVRLVCLDEVPCPRFHADYVTVRLLLSYYGVGSEWLADADVNREHLGFKSAGIPDAESGLMLPGVSVRHISTGHVALLKGRNWVGNENRGAVHRSPSLALGERRVLLALDALD